MNVKNKLPTKKITESKSLGLNPKQVDEICKKIIERVNSAKDNILRTIDTEMVKNYWLTGKDIVEGVK